MLPLLVACGASWRDIGPPAADTGLADDSGMADTADTTDSGGDTAVELVDADADGFTTADDCDDADPAVNPAAIEQCDPDDVDEDCDGAADDADEDATGKIETFVDADADGHGVGEPALSCEAGGAPVGDDCDDTDATRFPQAADPTDGTGTDNDCDGFVDEDGLVAGDVLVTEMFWRGNDVVSTETRLPEEPWQWIELANTALVPLDLSGWTLRLCLVSGSYVTATPSEADCATSTEVSLPVGTRVDAGGHLVVCENQALMPYCDVDFGYAEGMAAMSSWNGWVGLVASGVTLGPAASTPATDLQVDTVAYYAKTSTDWWPIVKASSMRFDDSTLIAAADATANDAYGAAGPKWTAWCAADKSTTFTLDGKTMYGTPGAPNGECP